MLFHFFQTIRFDTDPPNSSKRPVEEERQIRRDDNLEFLEEDSLYCRSVCLVLEGFDPDVLGSNLLPFYVLDVITGIAET